MIEGKLYKCHGYYLMIYPTKEPAAAAAVAAAATIPAAAVPATRAVSNPWASARANYWSKRLNCTVRYSEPNETFMYLNESKDEFAHVLFGEKQGWIIIEPWFSIEGIEQ